MPSRARFSRSPTRDSRRGLRLADVGLAVAILGLVAILAARFDRVETRQVGGPVVVNDGDTLTLGGKRIRLRGMDAPELGQTCTKACAPYACGRIAKRALFDLIADRPVVCEGWEHDRYARLLGVCRSGETDLNRGLVAEGWAVAFGDYMAEETAAREASRGLWSGEFERPRQWRDTHGSLIETEHDTLAAIVDGIRALFGLAPSS